MENSVALVELPWCSVGVGWKATVQSVIERFKELSESPNDEGLLAEDANPSSLRNALAEQNPREKLRIHFQKVGGPFCTYGVTVI